MEFDKVEKALRGREDLSALAETPEGRALSARLDDGALREAVRQGDGAALQDILQRVLSTPEGKALAEKVRKAVGKP